VLEGRDKGLAENYQDLHTAMKVARAREVTTDPTYPQRFSILELYVAESLELVRLLVPH
jgi:hypothetical protein